MEEFQKYWTSLTGEKGLPENVNIIYAFEAGRESKQKDIDYLLKSLNKEIDEAKTFEYGEDYIWLLNSLKAEAHYILK